jgi:pimeloyl-ACP methyl ester carboxylesterase
MKKILKIFAAIAVVLIAISFAGYLYIAHQVEGGYFKSGNIQIHYTDKGNGVPVVLVHGFAANSDLNWRRPGMYQRLLDESFRVITMDLRGHGKSGKPHADSEYGEKMAVDVINLLDFLELEKAHLAGYSLGGFVALKAAAQYPERWITVTAMASGWEDPEGSNSFDALRKAMTDFESGKPVGPLINYFDETGNMKTGFLHTQMFKILTTYLNDRSALSAIIKSARGLAVTKEELSAIKVPVCGIVGDKDPFLNKAKAMSGVILDHKLTIIKGADHITTMTSREAKDALVDFLKRGDNLD